MKMQPPTNGDCLEDQFLITGHTGNKLPPICGVNTGQHSEYIMKLKYNRQQIN